MRFIKILLVMVATIKALSAYENANVRFEVEKLGTNRLTIRGFEGSRSLFNQTVDRSFNAALIFGQNVLSRHGSGYKILYRGEDNTSLGLEVDQEGNIAIANSREGTGFAARKSWGFKTSGVINHTGTSLFFEIFTKANAFHNHGILKAYTGECLQDYLFNKGIIHFGNETDYVDADTYEVYRPLLNSRAAVSFQHGIIDDHGVILAEKGLRITNLVHKIRGILDVEQGLDLNNASIENTNGINVSGPITGTVNRFTNSGEFFAETLQSNRVQIGDWANTGGVFLERTSDILSEDKWSNKGAIFVGGNTSVGSKKKPQSFGIVLSDGEIKAMIGEAVDEASIKTIHGTARFFSRTGKITIDVAHHTDHLLNTITNHYTVDQWGRETFTHTTETGYIFQRRTTEIKKETIDVSEECDHEPIDDIKQKLQRKRTFLKELKNGIKDRLKKLGLLHASKNGIMAALMKGLSEAGLSIDDIDEIFGGEGYSSNLLDIVSAYEQLPPEGRQSLQSDLPALHSFLSDTALQAQRTGVPIWQWAQRNGPAFVERFCNLAVLVSDPTQSPSFSASEPPLGHLTSRPTQSLQKAQMFFDLKDGLMEMTCEKLDQLAGILERDKVAIGISLQVFARSLEQMQQDRGPARVPVKGPGAKQAKKLVGEGLKTWAEKAPQFLKDMVKNIRSTKAPRVPHSGLPGASAPASSKPAVNPQVVIAEKGIIQFGRDANQTHHVFRHIDKLKLDRNTVQSAIQNHLKIVEPKITDGVPFNQIIEVSGKRIQYTAFKLSDGTINVGRIHGAS